MSFDLGSAVGVITLDTSGFSSGIRTARQGLSQFLNDSLDMSTRITGLGDAFTNVGTKMTKAITLPLAGIATYAVKSASDFESAMANVAATAGMTAEQVASGVDSYKALEEAAREAARTTAWTATEAADALNYMIMSGMDYKQAIEDLPYFLNLATAGSMDLARVTDVVTDAMAALGIETTAANVEHFGDVLVRVSQKSNTSVAQLGDALLSIGPTARDLAGGINELAVEYGLLANQGIKGSEAGTILRNVLAGLNERTDKAAQLFQDLGFSAYDAATGDLRPLEEVFIDLNNAMADMSSKERFDNLKTIFGIYNVAGARSLMVQTVQNTEQLAKLFEDVGMTAEDSTLMIHKMQETYKRAGGDMDKYTEAIQNMGLSSEQAEIALGGMQVLITDGASVWQQLKEDVEGASGAMQSVVDIKLQTLEGQVDLLKSAFSDFAITIGQVLIPYVLELVKKGQQLFTWLNNLDDSTKDIVVKIGLAVAAAGPLLSIFGGLTTNITKLIPVMTTVVKGFEAAYKVFGKIPGPLGIVIGLATALFTAYQTNFLGFQDLVNNLWQAIKSGFGNMQTAITDFIHNAVKLKDDFVSAWKDFVEYAPQIPKQFIDGLIGGFKSGWENVKSTVKNLFNSLIKTSEDTLEIHSPSRRAAQIGMYWDMGLAQGLTQGQSLVDDGIDYIVSIFENAGDSIIDTFQQVGRKGSQQLYSGFAENVTKTLALFQRERDQRISMMTQGTDANIAQMQKEISATKNAYDIKMQLYNAEYQARMRLLDTQLSEEQEALQAQIDAIDAMNEAEDRAEAEDKYNLEVVKRQAEIDAMEDEAEKLEKIAELEEYKAQRLKALARQDRSDQQKALRQQMNDAQKRVQAQKAALEEELAAKQQALAQQRDAEIAYMNKMMELLQQDLALRKELAETQTKIKSEQEKLATGKLKDEEKKQVQNNLSTLQQKEKDIKSSLLRNETEFKSFTPKLKQIGDSYGTVLYQGISSTEKQITNYMDYLLQKANDVIARMQQAARAAGEAQSAVADYNYEVANAPAVYSGGGDTYNFYSNERLTEAEISRQFRATQKDLALGF